MGKLLKVLRSYFLLVIVSLLFLLPITNQSQSSSIFTVVGEISNSDGTHVPNGLNVLIENKTRNLSAEGILGAQEAGKYGIVFLDTNNKTVANEGEILKITVSDDGEVLISIEYTINAEDVSRSMASVDLVIVGQFVSASIDSYAPLEVVSVKIGSSVNIGMTFTNTGNIPWRFIAGASIFDSTGKAISNYEKTLDYQLQPGQQANVSWNHVVNKEGEYWLQFGVWKDKPYISENLLVAVPKPSSLLIIGLPNNDIPEPDLIPDLIIDSITFPEYPVAGEAAEVALRVKNIGDKISQPGKTSVGVFIYRDDDILFQGSIVELGIVNAIEPNASVNVSFDYTFLSNSYSDYLEVELIPVAGMDYELGNNKKRIAFTPDPNPQAYRNCLIEIITICSLGLGIQEGVAVGDTIIFYTEKIFNAYDLWKAIDNGDYETAIEMVFQIFIDVVSKLKSSASKELPNKLAYLKVVIKTVNMAQNEGKFMGCGEVLGTFWDMAKDIPGLIWDKFTDLEARIIYIFLDSPVNLMIKDSHGNITSVVGKEIAEGIANSYGMEFMGHKAIFIEGDDSYSLEVSGTEHGNYSLTVMQSDEEKEINITHFNDVVTQPGAIAQLSLNTLEEDYSLEIDNDGDGIADRSHDADSINSMIKGDVNDDGVIRSNDAILTLRIATGLLVPTKDQEWAADVNNDGNIRSNDAILILRKAAGLAAPGRNQIPVSNRLITITMDEALEVSGESIIVPVKVDNIHNLAGGDICITYDKSALLATNITFDPDILLASNTNKPGVIHIAFASNGNLNSQIIAEIHFDILAVDISQLKFQEVELYQPDGLLTDLRFIDGKFSSRSIPAEENLLMQNFPNPFNPETWIPYQLSEDAEVIIKIHTAAGRIIRQLDLGYKQAGYYINKNLAAYWDGKNEAGEFVSSGLYFCTIKAGGYVATMKMTMAK
ncbi:hypothetical protein GF312_15350 [Candidatus Poribacteria bacterium]|nr:hypothetical protein [Candidatus Poribacteria bacterium]